MEYANTRHNLGFRFIERLAQKNGVTLTPQGRFFGMTARLGDMWLLMPTTFMNRSGQAVSALTRFYRISPASIYVVHDDLDLPPGGIRIKKGGGNGGHNGLKDIEAALSTPDFWRLRLGIGHPRNLGLRQGVADFVLSRPRPEEETAIETALNRCLDAWPHLTAERLRPSPADSNQHIPQSAHKPHTLR